MKSQRPAPNRSLFASIRAIRGLSSVFPPSALRFASLAPARLIRRFPNLLLLRSCLWQSISTFPRSRLPFGLLRQPTAQPPCCLVPSQRPLACVRVNPLSSSSVSVLSVNFDSLRSLLRSCLRQSISLWSIVVNSAGFGLKTAPLKTLPTRRFYLDEKCFPALVSLHEFRSRDRSRDREIACTASRSNRILA